MHPTDPSVARKPAQARWATPRTDRPTAGVECQRIAEQLGVPLLPWQSQVLDVGLEYELDSDFPNGRRYIYREIDFGTPRQSGKSVLTLVKTLHRMILCGPGQKSVYSMQTGSEASRKLLDDWCPMIDDSPFQHAVHRVRRTAGGEGIHFKNRSTVEIMRTAKSSGHGRTLDEAIIDEAMHDHDDRREQAVMPAMLTRRNAQVLNTSTAGTDESLYWRRKVDLGRMAVEDGVTEGLCYFEWSAPDEADPYDEDMWWHVMPALGRTQPIESVRHLARTMREEEFRRAMLNQWTRTDMKVIDWSAWVECRNPHGSIGTDMVLALDVNKERTGAATVAASRGSDGLVDIELIDNHEGLSWLVPRAVELRDRHHPTKIIVDGTGPVGALIPELERAGLDLTIVGGGEMARAAGAFYDHVLARCLRVRPNEHLDNAVAGAAKRIRGDAFVWQRSTNSTDISPLVCATLALWGIAGDSNHGGLWLF
jgi:Phage Terminase